MRESPRAQESMREQVECFYIPTTLRVKSSTNLIIAIKIQVFSPPVSVLTTQTALTDLQNIIPGFTPSF